MVDVFLSHSSSDKVFAKRLAKSLENLGYRTWLDEWEIRVGDSIVSKIGKGIQNADFVVLVLSNTSTQSPWVKREWQSKYWDEIQRRRVLVLPVLIEDCQVPQLLRDKKYADFRKNYEGALVELAQALVSHREKANIDRYYADFVDIADDWPRFLQGTNKLDLLMMYSETWRNTYLKHLQGILRRPAGRIRVVLPAFDRSPSLLEVYAKRLEMSVASLKDRMETALSDFRRLREIGLVEVYTTTHYFNHACYLFDDAGILAFYSYEHGRVPTPAILIRNGDLLSFLRRDFKWVVSEDNQERIQLV